MVLMGRAIKVIYIYITCVVVIIFLFTGCSPIRQKEAKEEKEIFGFLDGYNHRIKEAQGCLKDAGFDPGPIDGKMQRYTRKAVKDFQKANGLEMTGFIGTETWQKLCSNKKVFKGAQKTKKEEKPLKYYSSSSEGIKDVQRALKNAGFDPGIIDGEMGSKTKKAIVDFQAAKGLPAKGAIDSKTIEALSNYFIKK